MATISRKFRINAKGVKTSSQPFNMQPDSGAGLWRKENFVSQTNKSAALWLAGVKLANVGSGFMLIVFIELGCNL